MKPPKPQKPDSPKFKKSIGHQTRCGVKHKPLRGIFQMNQALDNFMASRGMLSPSELAELKTQARLAGKTRQ
jgi:hypothetical protein